MPTSAGEDGRPAGPLVGMKIVELAGIGPAPFGAMLFADMGATVIRIDRKDPVELGIPRPLHHELLKRSRRAIALDLKDPKAVALVLRLIEQADGLIEAYRPGVMERLGLGPDTCLKRNPRLVYGRMTGWGQTGPLAKSAAHDLNYVAITGALNAIGRKDQPPTPPLALVGDFGGGGMLLTLGMLAALWEARSSGKGQVVDAAVAEGASLISTFYYGVHAGGGWNPQRGSNSSDSGSYYYDVYECADGHWISIAPIETRFFDELLRRMEIDPALLGDRKDRSTWPKARAVLAERFKSRTRQAWCELLEGSDACFAPVLSWGEAPQHPHFVARTSFVEVDGVPQPAPAPKFSRTQARVTMAPQAVTPMNTRAALADWMAQDEIETLRGVVELD